MKKHLINPFFSVTFLWIFAAFLFLGSCKNSNKQEKPNLQTCEEFSIQNFNSITNWQSDSSFRKTIFLDYNNALNGFLIPSNQQINDSAFTFTFEIKNNSSAPKKFYYKIYYQNESYKFPEFDSVTKTEHQFAEENFYGSWNDPATGFKETTTLEADNKFHTFSDRIRIIGNPRNEERYIQRGENNRWQRNPRVGNYSFLLVITSEKDKNNIPEFIQHIEKKNKDRFENPYYYYLFGDGKKLKNSIASISETTLKVIAQPDLGTGIYIDQSRFTDSIDRSHFCASCGQSDSLFKNAPVQQFINYVDTSTKMDNIPVIDDVVKNNYSIMDYNWNKSFYKKNELIPTIIQTSKKPCETVFSDAKEKKIVIKNPGTKYGEWKKESVGIMTRHGLTYGKYRVKIKMTELLSKNGVWNGLTNAIWLFTQARADWNFRRNCNKEGYMENYWGGPNDKRVPAVGYSEIDFEILKTPPYCPDNAFPPVYKSQKANNKNIAAWNISFPEEIENNKDKITVACTNWDMACKEPKGFGVNCNQINYKDQSFYTHRWDDKYRALNEKKEESDNELFQSPYFYFEIDWRPTEIIWSIGASPDKMRVVGYMNDFVTSIPNNQMILIITQEFHNTKWWPGAPFSQDNIPFPLNDLKGEIYDITIE
jgi:hypothetical protein